MRVRCDAKSERVVTVKNDGKVMQVRIPPGESVEHDEDFWEKAIESKAVRAWITDGDLTLIDDDGNDVDVPDDEPETGDDEPGKSDAPVTPAKPPAKAPAKKKATSKKKAAAR